MTSQERSSFVRLKQLFRIVSGATPSPEPIHWGGEIPWATPVDVGKIDGGTLEATDRSISETGLASCATEIAPIGSLVLSTRAPIGYVAETRIPLAINQGCRLLVPKSGVEASFYRYILSVYRERLQALGRGSTFIELGTSDLGNLRVPSPPRVEQREIVRFLDEETARIDALIEKKQELLGLMRERMRRSVASLLLGDLDNCVRVDSGVEWIGDAPSGWSVQRLGTVFRERDDRGDPDLPQLLVSLRKGVVLREFADDRIERVAADLANQKIARKGDLVFNKMRMWQGAVGVAPEDGLVSTDYTVARPVMHVDSRFIAGLLKTPRALTEVDKWSHGMVRDRNRLYWMGFKNIRCAIPPLDEQSRILGEIERLTESGTDFESRIKSVIDKLHEYRSSLITAAVTGQIDVGRAA